VKVEPRLTETKELGCCTVKFLAHIHLVAEVVECRSLTMIVCEVASGLASSPSMSYASLYTFKSLRPKRVEFGFGDVTVIQ
jgi:hypothetical protein